MLLKRGNIMDEKKAIERAIADAFITLYNQENGTSYSIDKHADAPDICCVDPEGNTFSFEITLTENRPNDITAMLGRSDHKTVERVQAGIAQGKSMMGSCLQGEVVDMIVSRIQSKLTNDYGSNVALVVQDTSRVPWDWYSVLDQIRDGLNLQRNPFDMGIWIINFLKDEIYRIL